jgi:hypothetical protein
MLDKDQWFDCVGDMEPDPNGTRFDEFGDYRYRVTVQHAAFFHGQSSDDIEDIIDRCVYHSQTQASSSFHAANNAHEHQIDDNKFFDPDTFEVKLDPRTVAHKTPNYSLLRPFFGWLSTDIIKETFQRTTQYARLPSGTLLKRTFKSSNPALNVTRRNESVACDIVYSDEPAVDNGATAAVIFTGFDRK